MCRVLLSCTHLGVVEVEGQAVNSGNTATPHSRHTVASNTTAHAAGAGMRLFVRCTRPAWAAMSVADRTTALGCCTDAGPLSPGGSAKHRGRQRGCMAGTGYFDMAWSGSHNSGGYIAPVAVADVVAAAGVDTAQDCTAYSTTVGADIGAGSRLWCMTACPTSRAAWTVGHPQRRMTVVGWRESSVDIEHLRLVELAVGRKSGHRHRHRSWTFGEVQIGLGRERHTARSGCSCSKAGH